ncbi:MAG: phosphatase PAP2 family protein [Parahaliea sp.]
MNLLQELDLRLLAGVFRQGERRLIRPLAKALSRSGDGYLHGLIPLLLALLNVPDHRDFIALLVLALAMERCLYWPLKNCLKRRRPQDAIPGFHSIISASDQFSFPSGHSSAAFLLATSLALIFGAAPAAMYLWACGVALSRVVLGVHFPGDTLAGALMGCGCALMAASLLGL